MLINCKQLFRDSFHVLKGFCAILSYAICEDQINVSLSYFSTASQIVKPGNPSTYAVGICNISKKNLWLKLFFDIYSKENAAYSEGHYAHFEKDVFVRAHEDMIAGLIYDWKDYAVIEIDDVSFKLGVFRSGDTENKGKHLVKSQLLDEKRKIIDELTLVQNLSE